MTTRSAVCALCAAVMTFPPPRRPAVRCDQLRVDSGDHDYSSFNTAATVFERFSAVYGFGRRVFTPICSEPACHERFIRIVSCFGGEMR
jgi:hypothetical protein